MAKSEVEGLRARAQAAEAEGRFGEAARDWSTAGDRLAIRHKDAAVDAYRHAARTALRARDGAAARDAADRGVAAAGGARWTHSLVDALRGRAEVWEHLGHRLEAVTDLRTAVTATAGRSRAPERCAARADLGVALVLVGLGEEGIAELDAAVKLGAQKKWMAPQVERWSEARSRLWARWAWAGQEGGRPVGIFRGPDDATVYVEGTPYRVARSAPGVYPVLLGERRAVLTIPLDDHGVARISDDPLAGTGSDATTEATETGGPGPASAPTEV